MTDLELLGFWCTVLVGGAIGCMIVHAAGLATTYVRDLLHVGAGVWVLGWPAWDDAAPPFGLALAITTGIALVPFVAPHLRLVERFSRSVAGGDETWSGLVLYGLSYTTLTAIGLTGDPFPAAAGLLALSLGDGLGGAAGRRWGAHTYRFPWAKRKSLEGSIVVAAGAAAATVIAMVLFDVHLPIGAVIVIAVVAALAEAIAPRSGDNLLVPASVFAAATLLGGAA